ncbi:MULTISPECIES: response regulator aspartate phosphatase [Bacillus]|uniref:response regulator aspartate phosphatase n=1 Tax=Bacillus TaxID=1386 RepID=UPI001C0E6113|nr:MULTISPECIES: aspartate phosphatase [Bacillus]MBU4617808.1 aspartate phosphatase [Bacillus sp. GG161]WOI40375.1 aspartate phosphatase [Bacillus altitudinis]
MGEKVASPIVAKMIGDWYGFIKKQDILKAETMRNEIVQACENMEEDQNVLLYFNLIDARYKMMVQEFEGSKELLKQIDIEEKQKTDDMIHYYYFFFNGMYEFYKKRFSDAINYYHIAETRLRNVLDELERAEFNYQLAIAYYEIAQNHFSINHAKKALESFKSADLQESRVATTLMVIASNKMDLNQFVKAESTYKDAINLAAASNLDFPQALGYLNLGICYERQGKLQQAMDSFHNVLSIELKKPHKTLHMRTKYMLARALFQLDKTAEGLDVYNESLMLANELSDNAYIAKLNIIHSIYVTVDENKLDVALNVLKSQKLWTDAAELSIMAARFYKKQDNYKLASKYFDEGLESQAKKLTWMEEEAE